ncbi:hypothetical protein ACRALDRAFT_213188 [Sodiomyces alcalophilus JCM 7366]|uniref:uncharacterized protein n=1 Tax=Sodiomyces alcalophilus JCM 7366 TaxID=591952 RepID=UPI0039B42E1C
MYVVLLRSGGRLITSRNKSVRRTSPYLGYGHSVTYNILIVHFHCPRLCQLLVRKWIHPPHFFHIPRYVIRSNQCLEQSISAICHFMSSNHLCHSNARAWSLNEQTKRMRWRLEEQEHSRATGTSDRRGRRSSIPSHLGTLFPWNPAVDCFTKGKIWVQRVDITATQSPERNVFEVQLITVIRSTRKQSEPRTATIVGSGKSHTNPLLLSPDDHSTPQKEEKWSANRLRLPLASNGKLSPDAKSKPLWGPKNWAFKGLG